MKSIKFHTYDYSIMGSTHQVLSIFIASHKITENEFDTDIAFALASASAPDAVHIVGYKEDVFKINDWLKGEENASIGRLRTFIANINEALRFIYFDEEAGQHAGFYWGSQPIACKDVLDYERQNSLTTMFREAGGLQLAGIGTHFEKTSETHSDSFLRVSNVLEDGDNVKLMAFWLLPHMWKKEVNSIIVDTSGIYSIALIASHESIKRGGLKESPRIWSHKSYYGVNSIKSHAASKALFLISASTSGRLAEKLIKQGAQAENVVTLFSLSSQSKSNQKILCDLKKDNNNGFDLIKNYNAENCELCRNSFQLIKLQGDQFSVTPPKISLLEIKAVDLPSTIKDDISALLGLKVFSANARSSSGKISSIGINSQPIFNSIYSEKNRTILSKKRELWKEYVRRSSTISTRHIVASNYKGSREIADHIASDIKSYLQDPSTPQVVSPSELSLASPQEGTSTIVVSACIDNSKEFLAISRTLRDVQEGGTTSYLGIFDAFGTKTECDRLRTNITYGKYGVRTFNLHTLFSLPIECYEEKTSWESELEELSRVIDWADNQEMEIPTEIEDRINKIRSSTSTGLIDNLFWPAADGKSLALRSDFTLIEDARRTPEATQADLYTVINTVLTFLRNNSDISRRLEQNSYERKILAPHNFDRYNDGVLQACILRAARPKELAYGACEDTVSEQMLEILMHTLPDDKSTEKSEALMEFLISILIGRMTLHEKHLIKFCSNVIELKYTTKSIQLIAKYIHYRTGKNLCDHILTKEQRMQ